MASKQRALLVGCGGISAAWLRAARNVHDLEIVGLVDVIEEAARKRADEYNLSHALVTTDFEAALQQTSPGVVFNCTIPESHAPITLQALAHGCHVLTEKPLADTIERARELVQAADAANRILAVIQNRRYDTNIRRLRGVLETGELGRITTVNSDFYIGAHFGGFRDHMEHVLLLDMAIHTLDAARLISGAEPVSVYCREWNPVGSWYDHDASAVAVFEMSDGIIYTYRGSWCAEGVNTTWEADWRVVCEHGSITWDGDTGFRAQRVVKTGGFLSEMGELSVPDAPDPSKSGHHEGVIREFVRCVAAGGTPETVASDNIKSLAMVFSAIESAESGRVVPVRW